MKDNSNITQELLETIERFYNNSMSKEERIEFETKLKQDANFKSQVEDIKALLFGIETQALKEKMDDFHKDLPIQMKNETASPKVRFLNFRNIAVAVIIILGSASFWFFSGSTNDRLYDTYFKPDPGLPTTMSSTDNFQFFDAMVNYKQGDYKKAINKWEVLHEKSPKNDTLNYFLGVAYLANKSEEKAITYLEDVTSSNSKSFKNDAHYYLGMAYLKKNDLAEAKKNLELSSMDDAKTVLSKIKD